MARKAGREKGGNHIASVTQGGAALALGYCLIVLTGRYWIVNLEQFLQFEIQFKCETPLRGAKYESESCAAIRPDAVSPSGRSGRDS